MAAISRLAALVALFAVAVPMVAATGSSSGSQSCSGSSFWWKPLNACVDIKNIQGSAPKGSSCPDTHGWNSGRGCCTPTKPTAPEEPSCKKGKWNSGRQCCNDDDEPTTTKPATPSTPTGSSSCGKNEFWWGKKSCCLPSKPPTTPSKPPANTSCPPSWYWHGDKSCCVPTTPSPPAPTCDRSSGWNDSKQCCNPSTPQPSGKSHKKRMPVNKSLCPSGLTACPISSLQPAGDMECLDTAVELESCGGCATTGAGQDCTAIPSARGVGCEAGSCAVYSCLPGFSVAADGKTCIAADVVEQFIAGARR